MGASISVMYLYALFMSGNSFIKMGRGFAALQSSIINSIEIHQERNEKRTIPSMKHVIVFSFLHVVIVSSDLFILPSGICPISAIVMMRPTVRSCGSSYTAIATRNATNVSVHYSNKAKTRSSTSSRIRTSAGQQAQENPRGLCACKGSIGGASGA